MNELLGYPDGTKRPKLSTPTLAATTAQEDKQIEAVIRAKLAKSKIGRGGNSTAQRALVARF